MVEYRTWLGKRGLKSLKDRLQSYLGERPEIVGEEIITQNPLTAAQVEAIWDRINGIDVLSDWLTSAGYPNLHNVTLAQARAQVQAISSLADAKAYLDKMTVIVWLLIKREMGEI
jgi:hypothetical protein